MKTCRPSLNPVGFWYLASRELNVVVEQSNLNVPKEFQLQQNLKV